MAVGEWMEKKYPKICSVVSWDMTKSWGVSHCNESSNYFLSTSRCVHVTVSDNSFEPVRATWKSELLIEQQPVFHRHLPKIVSCRKLVSQHQGSVILQTALTELGHYYYLCLLLFAKCVYGFSLFCEYCHCLFPLFFFNLIFFFRWNYQCFISRWVYFVYFIIFGISTSLFGLTF